MSEQRQSRPRRGCFGVGCVVLFLFLVLGGVLSALWLGGVFGPGVPAGTIVVVRLDQSLPDHAEPDFLSLLGEPGHDLLGVRRGLLRAARDPLVSGVLVQIVAPGVGAATALELADTIEEVRASGKFVVAHLDGGGLTDWVVASAADEILLDRTSTLDTTGLAVRAFFLRDALARWGLRADLVRVGNYKGTYEQLTAAEPSAEFDESMDALVGSLFTSLVERGARGRGATPERLRALIDRAPFRPERALEEGLVDRLVWGDEVPGAVRARVEGVEAELLTLDAYLARASGGDPAQHVAVVPIQGIMLEGDSTTSLLGAVSGADTVTAALRRAVEDDDAVAIVLRIDSPGGSVGAAEKVWRAARQAATRKPLVASLGAAAASGGYYAAAAADHIVAQPTTMTGSIGVFGGKLVVEEFLARQEVGIATYSRGARAGIFSPAESFDEDEREALQGYLAGIYQDFVARVASARDRPFEEVDGVARGRVWSGRDALGVGLVDALGGLDDALAEARKLARIPPSRELGLRVYPEPPGLLDLLSAEATTPYTRAALPVGAPRSAAALAEELRRRGLLGRHLRLAIMPFLLGSRAE